MSFGAGSHLHLIDGSAFIFRAYHALPPLTRSDGLPVGAVQGFCNMLFKLVEDASGPDAPTHVAVIFDYSGHTFRNEIYPDYKANRPPAPEDLVPQFGLIREATRAFNLPSIEVEGFEADDIIATLARQGRAMGGRVSIISSDKDLMQLVGEGVEMFDPIKNKRIDADGVFEKFGVAPNRVVDVQSLAGDSVDNVPGAPGIGIKTAAMLISEFGDLDALLEGAETIKQPKRRQTLIDFADQIRISRALVRLDDQVALDSTPDDFDLKAPIAEDLLGFLAKMEFRTLSTRIAGRLGVEAPTINRVETGNEMAPAQSHRPIDTSSYETVQTAERLQYWLDKIYARGLVAFDTETTGLNEMTADLVGISLATEEGEACYIPLGHMVGEDSALFGGLSRADGQIPLDVALGLLGPMLSDPSILKIGQNIKYDYKIMARLGVFIAPIADTLLMSFAANSGRHNHGMDELSKRYLDHAPIPIKSLLGTGKAQLTFDRLSIAEATPYAAEDADITLRLYYRLIEQMRVEGVTHVYERIERPMVPVLAAMERAGIRVDRNHLAQMSNKFAQELAQLEDEIKEAAGIDFNVNSPKQLGEVLFDHLGLPGGKKGKMGAYGTGADVLEDLATEHELPRLILDYRGKAKLKSTYTDALQNHINPDTDRVHTSYAITGAATGRLASNDPNVQNIPVRTEEGRRIREAFIASEGYKLVSLDYSQIELRLLAEIAHIDELKAAFAKGQDIHALTASEMFNVPLEGMDPMIRRQAKAINFGVIYGISAFGLARNLRIRREVAKGFIDRYFERFPGIRQYMDRTVEGAKKSGYVSTLFGRKIHTPQINEKGPQGGFAWRAAINAPIQGSAADIIRRAMVRVPAAMDAAGLSGKMLLQVHDELVFDVPEAEVEATITTVKSVMENAAKPAIMLSVPLEVDAGVGNNWAEAH